MFDSFKDLSKHLFTESENPTINEYGRKESPNTFLSAHLDPRNLSAKKNAFHNHVRIIDSSHFNSINSYFLRYYFSSHMTT